MEYKEGQIVCNCWSICTDYETKKCNTCEYNQNRPKKSHYKKHIDDCT